MGAMGYVEYIMFFVFATLVIVLSYLLQYMWVITLSNRIVVRIFVTPGIIIHELSHAVGCLLMGAKIGEIKFFTETGGHVKHGKPKVPVIGQPVISMAPLFGIPLFLFLLAFIFGFFNIAWFPNSFPQINSPGSAWDFATISFIILWQNFWVHHYWWFLIFLYFALSLVTCIAPSGSDFKNCIIGLAVIFGVGLLFLFGIHALNANTGLDWSTPVIRFIINWLYYAVGIGLVLELLAMVITLPIFLITMAIRRRV